MIIVSVSDDDDIVQENILRYHLVEHSIALQVYRQAYDSICLKAYTLLHFLPLIYISNYFESIDLSHNADL